MLELRAGGEGRTGLVESELWAVVRCGRGRCCAVRLKWMPR